jgi:hypothetical protein
MKITVCFVNYRPEPSAPDEIKKKCEFDQKQKHEARTGVFICPVNGKPEIAP